MEVILAKDVQKLGRVGDVVKVKDGFARNFLFPQGKAFVASKGNLRRIEQQKAKAVELYASEKGAAEKKAEEVAKISATITVEVNDQEKLYGAVTEAEIIQALAQEGQTVDKKDLVIEKPIDELGIFEVGITLHPEVTAKFRLWVTKK